MEMINPSDMFSENRTGMSASPSILSDEDMDRASVNVSASFDVLKNNPLNDNQNLRLSLDNISDAAGDAYIPAIPGIPKEDFLLKNESRATSMNALDIVEERDLKIDEHGFFLDSLHTSEPFVFT
jgi:hypothetical protein